jgi:hypothetical protein
MAAGPLKTISFLPLPVKGKPLRNGGGAVTHRGHREYSGRAIVGTGRKSHAVVISRRDLTPLDVRNWLQCETGLDNDRRARGLAEKHQRQRTARTVIKKINPHLTPSQTTTSLFPLLVRPVRGLCCQTLYPLWFSKVAERLLTVCAEFQRERVEPPFLGRVS